MQSIAKPTLILMCGRMFSFAVTLFIPVALVRIFTPVEFGTYKQWFLVYMTVYSIAQLGMSESLYYFLPRHPAKGGRYALNAVLMLLISATLCAAFLVGGQSRISQLLSNSGLAEYLPLLGVYLLGMTASAALEVVMVTRNQYPRAAFTYSISDVLRAAFLLGPVLLLRNLSGLFWGAAAYAVVRFGATLVFFWREFGADFRWDAQLLRKQLAYAIPFELAVVVEVLQANYHQYAVSHYFDAATFAIYSIGCLQIPLIEMLASPAGNVMMVRMGEELRDGRPESVVHLWHETTRKLALVFVPLFALLLLVARDFIAFLFTEQYAASASIFTVWCTTLLLSTVQTDSALRVYAQTRFLLVLNLGRLLIITGLIYPFLSAFGLIGAVSITLLASGFAKGLSLARLRHLFQVRVSALLPWRSLAAIGSVSFAAGVIPLLIKTAWSLPTVPQLLVVGTIFTACYLALVWQAGLLNDQEKIAIVKLWQRIAMFGSSESKCQVKVKEEDKCVA